MMHSLFCSNGYAFLLASALNMDVEKRYSVIEDVMAQADIVQEKYMQVRSFMVRI